MIFIFFVVVITITVICVSLYKERFIYTDDSSISLRNPIFTDKNAVLITLLTNENVNKIIETRSFDLSSHSGFYSYYYPNTKLDTNNFEFGLIINPVPNLWNIITENDNKKFIENILGLFFISTNTRQDTIDKVGQLSNIFNNISKTNIPFYSVNFDDPNSVFTLIETKTL